MNLRKLKLDVERPQIRYDFTGYKSMAGINEEAVAVKDKILSRIIVDAIREKSYPSFRTSMMIILRVDERVGSYNVEIHNDIMYINWKMKHGEANLSLRLYLKEFYTKMEQYNERKRLSTAP